MPAETLVCPACGAENPARRAGRRCRSCGGDLTAQPPPAEFRLEAMPAVASPPPTPEAEPQEVEPPSPEQLPLLAPAPREVPLALRLPLLFGGPAGLFGWLFAMIGSLVLAGFLPFTDLVSPRIASQPSETTRGVILRVELTSCTENEHRVYAYHYGYRAADGEVREGVSFAYADAAREGDRVDVRYLRGSPEVAKVEGMRARPFGLAVLFVLIFPLVGLCFIAATYAKGRRAIDDLRNGILARGKLRDVRGTNVVVNNRPVLEMVFEFVDRQGVTQTAKARTTEPAKLQDQPTELLIYRPDRPASAVLLDALPGSPVLSESGEWQAPGGGRAAWLLLLPVLTLTALAIGVWLALR